MTPTTATVPEVLRARPRRWLSRLWVRVSLVLLLICAICVAVWWWPRRTMVAVWWAGGEVHCPATRNRTHAVLSWFDPTGTSGLRKYQTRLDGILVWTCEDREIEFVSLEHSLVRDEWLRALRRFPRITTVAIHGRQLGPGLDHLRDCAELNCLFVEATSNGCLTELRRLPELERVHVLHPATNCFGWDSLAALPKLRTLSIGESQSTNRVLAALPDLPQLKNLQLIRCTGFDDDDLRILHRLRNLQFVSISGETPLGDTALGYLSQLDCLERLHLRSPWSSVTRNGLQGLGQMKKLKDLLVEKSQCTPAQLQMLRDELPNCTITVH